MESGRNVEQRLSRPGNVQRTRDELRGFYCALAVALALGGWGQELRSGASDEFDRLAEQKTTSFLSELSARRRVTTLLENRQSAFHGVQENFVNTSVGNLTFLVRDLVRVGGMPIVMGRVYDSTISAAHDGGGRFRSGLAPRSPRGDHQDQRPLRLH